MKRPEIINFFKKGTTLAYVHEVYKMNPELWGYIQAQDKFIDHLQSQLKERDAKCLKIINESIMPIAKLKKLRAFLLKNKLEALLIKNKLK